MTSEFIKPQFPLVPRHIKLPPLDQIEHRFYVHPILVFRVESSNARESIVQDFYDGLANTIEHMPFIAADVIPDNVDRGTVQLDIADDAGVWFHTREIPEITF